jgi:hypothetical protein
MSLAGRPEATASERSRGLDAKNVASFERPLTDLVRWTAHGLPVATNGCFGDAKRERPGLSVGQL